MLRAGLAGEPVRTSSALLYDEVRVRALAARPAVDEVSLARTCPSGLFVARLSRRARIDLMDPWPVTADRVAVLPRMPGLTAALAAVRLRVPEGMPWVATLCGFVVLCGQARGMQEESSGAMRFDLAPPGQWAVELQDSRLHTRSGRPWVLLEPGGAGLSARGAP